MRLLRCATVVFLASTSLTLSISLVGAERTPAEAQEITRRVLTDAVVIDTHADTPQAMLGEGYDLADPSGPYMISIPKMRAGHVGAEFFSIWVDVKWPANDLIHRALDLIDVVDEQVARHSDALGLALTAQDIEGLHARKKIAILLGVEGGHIIQNDLRALDVYHRLGVRYMTLTHTANTGWADSSGDKPGVNGLTDFGRQVVERMNRLGMMVDISHVSDQTFYAALAASQAPVIASHSSCRALCNAPRDMTDDMIRALAKNGGVMDINFYSGFLDQAYRDAFQKIEKQQNAELETARQARAREGKRLTYREEVAIQRRYEPQLPTPSFERIADHLDHAVKIGGVDHVGLGSDFDGLSSIPRGMEDASKLPNLVRELARRGYSEEDLRKILGQNVLRVMRDVEATARRMQSDKP